MRESPTIVGAFAAAGSASGEGSVERAAGAALSDLGEEPSLLMAFTSDLDAERAATDLGRRAGRVPLAGMTGSGVIGPGGAIQEGCVALAFGSGVGAGVGIARDAGRDLERAAAEATEEALAGTGGEQRTVILMLDTRSGDQARAVAGAYAAAGPEIPIVGGGAGGDEPHQYADGRALQDSVVAVAIGGAHPSGIGLAHGCRERGTPAIATRAEGRYLYELDGRPAAEVYLERLGYEGLDLGREDFAALAVTHPLAQPELNGQSRLRHVLGRGPEGGLECATHIPANAAVEFTHQSPADIVAASSRSVGMAVDALDPPAPEATLVFDCAGRKGAVAGALGDQVAGLLEPLGTEPPPFAGVFSHGEICRTRGAKGDRNHAVVVAAFA